MSEDPWEPLPQPPSRHPEFYRVLVCGSREFVDVAFARRVLEALRVKTVAAGKTLLVIEGGAHGADAIASDWAKGAPGVLVAHVPAPWHKMERSGHNGAGLTRNRAMLALGPDLVLAFFARGAGNRGTTAMVNYALEAGVPVKRWER
jgi:hypothetical protein